MSEFEINIETLNKNLAVGHTQKVILQNSVGSIQDRTRYIFHKDSVPESDGNLYYYLCKDLNISNRFHFCVRKTAEELLREYRMPMINQGEGRKRVTKKTGYRKRKNKGSRKRGRKRN